MYEIRETTSGRVIDQHSVKAKAQVLLEIYQNMRGKCNVYLAKRFSYRDESRSYPRGRRR